MIYKTKTDFIICTQSWTDVELLIADDPTYVLPLTCLEEEFKNAIFDCLQKSRKNIKTPKRDEWSEWQKERLKKMRQKSFTDLYKQSTSCDLRLENGILKIWPSKFYNPAKPSQGFVPVEEHKVEIKDPENNKDQVVLKVKELLEMIFN